MKHQQKHLGQFFTPPEVARSLVSWLAPGSADRLLDPSCGNGQFLALHRRSVGVEVDAANAVLARQRAPSALIHSGDFFTWASKTPERFEAAVGNPPFIRYQLFSGDVRDRAIEVSSKLGAQFNGLSSSWAPFLVATSSLLKSGGSMAFVVPAEIGHATYSQPLLECLCRNFGIVGIVAIRTKLFPDLGEDAWLLYCSGFGGRTDSIGLKLVERFTETAVAPRFDRFIPLTTWLAAGCRLRKFLLSPRWFALYEEISQRDGVRQFADVAHAGIGYVTGANDFFHLRPSEAKLWEIPRRCLRVAIRRSEQLPAKDVDAATVKTWLNADEPVLLLDLSKEQGMPEPVSRYLNTSDAEAAKKTYKCRNRDPWYVVPDIRVPDAFLSYMSGESASLVANSACCVCTNSVHAVRLKNGLSIRRIQEAWHHPVAALSCELEGHPLGGGMLKLEPGEAARIRLALGDRVVSEAEQEELVEAANFMRRWRHYA
jgi:hypothetical protein